jgi:hypothetical protein
MFSDFKLYDVLYSECMTKTESPDMNELVSLTRKMDPLGLQIISLLIQKDSLRERVKDEKVSDSLAKFDLREFDPILQHIILQFCKMHLSKQQEIRTSQLSVIEEVPEEL